MPKTWPNCPDHWDAILEVVGHHWSPVIAGGCIRDFFLGTEAKDVDVFVPAEFVEDVTAIVAGLNPTFCHGQLIWHNKEAWEDTPDLRRILTEWRANDEVTYSGDGFAPDLIAVWEGEILGTPVNIIGRRSLEDGPSFMVGTFDFNILKAYHGCHGHTITTNDFLRDREQRTATLAHGLSYAQSLRRFARFDERNPGVLKLVDTIGGSA